MRFLLIFLAFFIGITELQAQEDFRDIKLRTLPESTLLIAGSTNVNKFDCHFNIELISEPTTIKLIESSNKIIFDHVKLQLLTTGFDCGNKRMNSDFQDLLVAEHYPEIVIEIDKAELISSTYIKVNIIVQIANKNKRYELPVKINNDRFQGKFKINIRDFGLEPPKKALGLIQVDEMIEVQFDMKFSE